MWSNILKYVNLYLGIQAGIKWHSDQEKIGYRSGKVKSPEDWIPIGQGEVSRRLDTDQARGSLPKIGYRSG